MIWGGLSERAAKEKKIIGNLPSISIHMHHGWRENLLDLPYKSLSVSFAQTFFDSQDQYSLLHHCISVCIVINPAKYKRHGDTLTQLC